MTSRIAERFWSLAEAAERGVVGDRSTPVGVVRHVLDVLAALEAGGTSKPPAATTLAFLKVLAEREAAGDAYASSAIEGEDPGERAVVFSIGLLLFEGLTGRDPHGSVDGPRRLGRLSCEELVAMIRRASEVPKALRGVLMRSLGPDAHERFSSMAALRGELEWFVVAEAEQSDHATPIAVPLPPAAVYVEPHAHVPNGPRSAETDRETAIVPKLSNEDLMLPRDRRQDSIDNLITHPFDDLRNGKTGETNVARRSEPRAKKNETAKLVLIGLALVLLSGSLTAGVLLYLRR